MNAVFSPDGSKIIYTYLDAGGESRLVVRDLEGESEHVLLVSKSSLRLDLYWAENDTIFVGTGPGSGLLLSLD